jgi:hypothetical protein
LNTPGWNKSRLIWGNKMMEKTFKPISQNLGNNLINDVAEANRSKMMNRGRTHLLGH